MNNCRLVFWIFVRIQKAPSAGKLFWTIVWGLQIRLDIVTTYGSDGPPVEPYPSHQEMLASYLDLTQRITNS